MEGSKRKARGALAMLLTCLTATSAFGEPASGFDQWLYPEHLRTEDAREDTSTGEVTARTLLRHSNLANGIVWLGAAAAVNLAGSPPSSPNWEGGILLDDDLRDVLRSGSAGDRELADDISTGLLVTTIAAPLLLDAVLKKGWYDDDQVTAGLMAERWLEATALTVFTTELTKIIVGRERPFNDKCDGSPPSDADCDKSSRRESFFSGHSSVAATGAGLLCANALKRQLWGDTAYGLISCGLGISTAAATGILRIAADKHWSTDVVVGWAVGGLVGYFDVPGPFDLLTFTIDDKRGGSLAQGSVLPTVGRDSIGLRLAMRF